MATLAQKFASLNQEPPEDPTPPSVSRTTTAGTFPIPQDTFATPPVSPNPRPTPSMQSPRVPRTPQTASPAAAAAANAAAAVEAAADDEFASGLSAPASFGMFKKFNCTTRVSNTFMLVRMIVHNGVNVQDIEFAWISPRVLKLRLAWPEWFQNAEQMAEFMHRDDGQPLFPPDHPLAVDTPERNQALVEEDGRIWDDGFLTFDQDMSQEEASKFELLTVDISSQGKHVQVLQFCISQVHVFLDKQSMSFLCSLIWLLCCSFRIAPPPASSQKIKKARNAKLGAGARAAPQNVHTSSKAGNNCNGSDKKKKISTSPQGDGDEDML